MFLLFLLFIATITSVASLTEEAHGTNLDCTNDYDRHMRCEFEAQDCPQYKVTANYLESEDRSCSPKQQDSSTSRCVCSIEMLIIPGLNHKVTIWRGDQEVESRIINIMNSLKPNTSEITEVSESNLNYHVKWKTNMKFIGDSLSAVLMYRIKGDEEKVIPLFKPTTMDGLSSYALRDLEPSTTYVVRVKTTYNSIKYSDMSNEFEFTTSASHDALLLCLAVGLSIAALVVATAVVFCFVKVRRMWDKHPIPKLIIHPYKEMVLKPQKPITSSVSVQSLIADESKSWSLANSSSGKLLESSGISSGSSCLSYAGAEAPDVAACVHNALSKAFPNISPVASQTCNLLCESKQGSALPWPPCGPTAAEDNSGPSDIVNRLYLFLNSSQPKLNMVDGFEVQTEMVCDSAYQGVEGTVVSCPDQHAPASLPLNFSSAGPPGMATEMSYQGCNAHLGQLLNEEDSSLLSVSSGTDTTASCDPAPRVKAGYESYDLGASVMTGPNEEREVAAISDDSTNQVAAASHSGPPVGNDYQPFQSLVG